MTPPEEPLLKPSEHDEIQSCSFCGGRQLTIYSFNQDTQGCYEETHGVHCLDCSPEMASINEWNNAYCWNLLTEKEAEIKDLTKSQQLLSDCYEDRIQTIKQQTEVIRIAREAFKDICHGGSYGDDLPKWAYNKAAEALDKMNRVEGK